jgi:hypothetical protein
MKAFLAGMVLLVAVSVVAWLALDSLERSSSQAFHIDESVRL